MTRSRRRPDALRAAALVGAAAVGVAVLGGFGVSAASGADAPPGPEALGTPTQEQLAAAVRTWDPAEGSVRAWVVGPDAVRQWVVTDDAVSELEDDG